MPVEYMMYMSRTAEVEYYSAVEVLEALGEVLGFDRAVAGVRRRPGHRGGDDPAGPVRAGRRAYTDLEGAETDLEGEGAQTLLTDL